MARKIPISAARKLSEQHRMPLVVIFGIAADQEHFCITTYGATKQLCKLAASYGEQMAQAVLHGTVAAPETEPQNFPDEPVIYAGERHA